MSENELRANLTAQIQVLMQKIATLTGKALTLPAGYTFTKTLRYKDRNIDVTYLQIFLMSQGKDIYPFDYTTGYFGQTTFGALVRFQEKYRQEILIPAKITKGTGVLGFYTKQKINQMVSK
jgi:hypothetical protein